MGEREREVRRGWRTSALKERMDALLGGIIGAQKYCREIYAEAMAPHRVACYGPLSNHTRLDRYGWSAQSDGYRTALAVCLWARVGRGALASRLEEMIGYCEDAARGAADYDASRQRRAADEYRELQVMQAEYAELARQLEMWGE